MISIHAPVKGATSFADRYDGYVQNFNPRSREGSDPVRDDEKDRVVPISIHAPVKGATPDSLDFTDAVFDFNPRSREGSDGDVEDKPATKAKFQSTLP